MSNPSNLEFLPTTYSRYYKVRFYKKRNTDKVYEVQKLNIYLQTPLPILLDYPVKAKHFKIIVEDGEKDSDDEEEDNDI